MTHLAGEVIYDRPQEVLLAFRCFGSISRAKGNLNCLQVTTDTQADDEEKAQTVRIRQKTE